MPSHARLHSAKPGARGGYERSDDLIAETRTQCRAQIADAVGEAELGRLAAGPVLAGEQGFFGTLEPSAAAALDERDELLVDVLLPRLTPLDLLRTSRKDRTAPGL